MQPVSMETRRVQAIHAEQVLNGLLRTPKTRPGLIAATVASKISRNFVFGWLTEQVRTGQVIPLKSTNPPMYQLASAGAAEVPCPGEYPQWLDPRVLPPVVSRRVYIAGRPAPNHKRRGKKCVY